MLGAGPLRERIEHLAPKIGLNLAKGPVPAQRPHTRTLAEYETLKLLYEGNDTARIANERGVAPRTVETQLGRVYAKLKVHSAVEAVTLTCQERLFD